MTDGQQRYFGVIAVVIVVGLGLMLREMIPMWWRLWRARRQAQKRNRER